MVACAAGVSVAAFQLLVSQPAIGMSSGLLQQNSCATVDQLKQRLQLVIENGDESGAIEVISSLESLTLSKEALETTRIGLTVNDVRRRTAQTWPDVSKRCRLLIKSWQKLADFQRPQSSCGDSSNSNGGTPSLISPTVRRGITPRTPGGGKRVTSTDYKCATKDGVSPTSNNGSYAPRVEGTVHKSASVGAALCAATTSSSTATSRGGSQRVSPDMLPAGVDAASLNAKRKARGALEGETVAKRLAKSRTDVNISSTATSASNGSGTTTAAGGVSVARKDVQSTAELVAQLTGNLPQIMAVSLQNNKPEPTVLKKSTEKRINSAIVTENGNGIRVVFSTSSHDDVNKANSSASTLGKVKRRYTKRTTKFAHSASADCLKTVAGGDSIDSTEDGGSRALNGVLPKLETIAESASIDDDDDLVEQSDQSLSTEAFKLRRAANHWASIIPTIGQLESNATPTDVTPLRPDEFKKKQVFTVNEKKFVALPYCDRDTVNVSKYAPVSGRRPNANPSDLIHPLFSLSRCGQ